MDDELQKALDAGMARQLAAFRTALSRGMPRTGWKIGLNDPAAQERLGLSATIVGWLDGRRLFKPGAAYTPLAGSKPRVEAEVAICMRTDLPPGASLEAARASIASVAPAIEFVDANKSLLPIEEGLANNILHEGVLFGLEAAVEAAIGLVALGYPAVSLNGSAHRSGLPGRYPDDLAEVALHVANVLGLYGEQLLEGDRIICGSYIDPFDATSGDEVSADFGPLGTISFRIA